MITPGTWCTRRMIIGGSAAVATAVFGPASAALGKGSVAVSDEHTAEKRPKPKQIGIVLFDDFETLDVFGPVQMWGRLSEHGLMFVSAEGRPVRSAQGVVVMPDRSFVTAPQFDVLMVPGGTGTRALIDNPAVLNFVQRQNRGSAWTTSVCTGAAILAKAGVLDQRSATTNKLAFDWVRGLSDQVRWQRRARWVIDGKYATSSGVSAGSDMALALVELLYDRSTAEQAARIAEYQWNDDPANDPFAVT